MCGGNIHLCLGRYFPYLFLDGLRQTFIVKCHTPVSVYMGNRLIIPMFFFQAVPHGQAVPQKAIANIVMGKDGFLLLLDLFQVRTGFT